MSYLAEGGLIGVHLEGVCVAGGKTVFEIEIGLLNSAILKLIS